MGGGPAQDGIARAGSRRQRTDVSDLFSLLSLLAPFFGLITLGIVAARTAKLPVEGLAWMRFFLVYLSLPCLFFRLLADKPIVEILDLRFALLTTSATVISFILAFLAVALTTKRLPAAVLGGVAGCYSNIGYMGPPLVLSFLGKEADAPVALILIFDTLFLFTAVPALMSLAGIERRKPLAAVVSVLGRVVFHPFMLGTGAGLLVSFIGIKPPDVVDKMTLWLANAAAPSALFVLGVVLALQPVGRVGADVAALVLVKLIVHPLVAWLLLSLFGTSSPVWIQAAIVMAALPPALNIFVLSTQYRVGIERASACVMVGTILSMVTLTALLWSLRTGAVPIALFR
jgi:malonate transporter